MDFGARWTHLECATEPVERASLSGCLHLYVAPGKVRHPAAQPEASRFLAHEPPETDSLDPTGDAHVKGGHGCCSQPCVPKSGTKRTGATSEIRTLAP